MSEGGLAAVCEHYGVELPEAVGRAATDAVGTLAPKFRNGETVVTLSRGHESPPSVCSIFVPDTSGSGAVVTVDDDGDLAFYAVPTDVVDMVVARLVRTTTFAVVGGADEYLPPLVTDSGVGDERPENRYGVTEDNTRTKEGCVCADTTVVDECCSDEHDGYECTRLPDHDGAHIACGVDEHCYEVWGRGNLPYGVTDD